MSGAGRRVGLNCIKPALGGLNLQKVENPCSRATDCSLYFVLSYFLYSQFRSKTNCSVYVSNGITCSRAYALESLDFSTTKFFCAVYCLPNFSVEEY